ncbi:hypothetical protein MTO96_008792 [Rhipicephalus appendiculatus]
MRRLGPRPPGPPHRSTGMRPFSHAGFCTWQAPVHHSGLLCEESPDVEESEERKNSASPVQPTTGRLYVLSSDGSM